MIATSTTQDSVCFIDIKEKYKTMIPRDHRQEKNKLVRLDWGINTNTTPNDERGDKA
jgi:hypothetical protein